MKIYKKLSIVIFAVLACISCCVAESNSVATNAQQLYQELYNPAG
jgi:hypothetical protein